MHSYVFDNVPLETVITKLNFYLHEVSSIPLTFQHVQCLILTAKLFIHSLQHIISCSSLVLARETQFEVKEFL